MESLNIILILMTVKTGLDWIVNLALYLLAVAMPVNLDEKADDSLKRSRIGMDFVFSCAL